VAAVANVEDDKTQVFNNDDYVEPMDVAKCTMEIISSNRRSLNRTWDRMNPLIQLILLPCKSSNNRMKSIADVGCDHGMLALSLACIAWTNQSRDGYDNFLFSKVFGTDLSSQALENGGIASLKQVNDALSKIGVNNNKSIELPIQFRIGDGLSALEPGEANAIVIAGMGVHTMLDIILGTSEATTPIERVQSHYIFLQPTNSRPQHLIILYNGLQKNLGWELCDEKVAFVGGRWYISSYFRRHDDIRDTIGLYRFPGHYLLDNGIFDKYVRHHLEWLKRDFKRGPLAEEDIKWIKHISSLKEKDEWNMLTTWYL
jgi:tRNA A22 N-methylase